MIFFIYYPYFFSLVDFLYLFNKRYKKSIWEQEMDLNHHSLGYEPSNLTFRPSCDIYKHTLFILNII